jgi:hypothetical protein
MWIYRILYSFSFYLDLPGERIFFFISALMKGRGEGGGGGGRGGEIFEYCAGYFAQLM